MEMAEALAERRAMFGNDHATVAYSLSTLANVASKRKDAGDPARRGGGRGARTQRPRPVARRGSGVPANLLADSTKKQLRELSGRADAFPEPVAAAR